MTITPNLLLSIVILSIIIIVMSFIGLSIIFDLINKLYWHIIIKNYKSLSNKFDVSFMLEHNNIDCEIYSVLINMVIKSSSNLIEAESSNKEIIIRRSRLNNDILKYKLLDKNLNTILNINILLISMNKIVVFVYLSDLSLFNKYEDKMFSKLCPLSFYLIKEIDSLQKLFKNYNSANCLIYSTPEEKYKTHKIPIIDVTI